MQELWTRNVDWDVPLSDDLYHEWNTYYSSLESLRNILIPRWTGFHPDVSSWELHGFADASHRAYAAAIYLRVRVATGAYRTTLLIAKSKVAPVKKLSIPRLELCAAVLLTRLFETVLHALHKPLIATYGWSDSTIVLAWLQQHPSSWQVFVANRVSEIQTRAPYLKWNHVSSADNPADCASRGLLPTNFGSHPL